MHIQFCHILIHSIIILTYTLPRHLTPISCTALMLMLISQRQRMPIPYPTHPSTLPLPLYILSQLDVPVARSRCTCALLVPTPHSLLTPKEPPLLLLPRITIHLSMLTLLLQLPLTRRQHLPTIRPIQRNRVPPRTDTHIRQPRSRRLRWNIIRIDSPIIPWAFLRWQRSSRTGRISTRETKALSTSRWYCSWPSDRII